MPTAVVEAISGGFMFDEPDLVVPWGILPGRLLELLAAKGAADRVCQQPEGVYWLEGKALGGAQLRFAFYFCRPNWALSRIRLCRPSLGDMTVEDAFGAMQRQLEAVFGRPLSIEKGDYDSMPTSCWRFGSVTVEHFVIQRFGPDLYVLVSNEASNVEIT